MEGRLLVVTALSSTQVDRFSRQVLELVSAERHKPRIPELKAEERADLRHERLGRHLIAWFPAEDRVIGYANVAYTVGLIEGRVALLRMLMVAREFVVCGVKRDLITAALSIAFHDGARWLETPFCRDDLEFLLTAGARAQIGGAVGMSVELPWLPESVGVEPPILPPELAPRIREFPRVFNLPYVRELAIESA